MSVEFGEGHRWRPFLATMLKATAQSITPVVTNIIPNNFLKLGEILSEWKTAHYPYPKVSHQEWPKEIPSNLPSFCSKQASQKACCSTSYSTTSRNPSTSLYNNWTFHVENQPWGLFFTPPMTGMICLTLVLMCALYFLISIKHLTHAVSQGC